MLVLIVMFIGIALAKPWGSPSAVPPPAPFATASVSSSSTATPAAAHPSTSPASAGPSTDLFGISLPPAASADWIAIKWQLLAPDNPLRLLRSVLRWRGGYIAVGLLASDGATATPVWTSRDGGLWMPVPFNTPNTFWPGLLVVGVAEVPSGLVALTLLDGSYQCGAFCPTYGSTLPLMSWASPDGRSWTPNAGPDLWLPSTWKGPPLLAAGAAGLVAASPTWPTRMATSADGIHWRTMPSGELPSGLAARAIVATATRFTVVGALPVDADHERAVALQSVDGATWTGPYPLALATASAVILASTGPSWGATALVAGRNGFIATGQINAAPGAALWWQSANGREWRPLPSFPPLGPTTCTGEGCGSRPDGALAGDGQRMIALRGGQGAGVWASSDGLAWQKLAASGELPSGQAMQVILLPGGVLLSDGTTTWLGEAQGP